MKPTREQIESATPDELNEWVAEMMGWKVTPVGIGLPPDWKERRPGAKWVGQTDMRKIPKFSTDIAAAWQIVDWFTSITPSLPKQWFRLDQFRAGCRATFEVITPDEDCEYYSWDDAAAPLAICRAALLWWIEQPEME